MCVRFILKTKKRKKKLDDEKWLTLAVVFFLGAVFLVAVFLAVAFFLGAAFYKIELESRCNECEMT